MHPLGIYFTISLSKNKKETNFVIYIFQRGITVLENLFIIVFGLGV